MGIPEVPCPHYCLPLEPQVEILLEILKCHPKWSLRLQLNCYRIQCTVCLNPADF